MVLEAQPITVEQFEAFVDLPENIDKTFEFIGGEIYEVPTNAYAAKIAFEIGFLIRLHIHENNLDAHMTGGDGGYIIGGERYAPDVSYMPATKQTELDKTGYNSVPPDLAVEVVSSGSNIELDKLRIKITNYLAVGTTVWVVKPDDRRIEVHEPGHSVTIYRENDTLDGGDVLPDFSMLLSKLFKPSTD